MKLSQQKNKMKKIFTLLSIIISLMSVTAAPAQQALLGSQYIPGLPTVVTNAATNAVFTASGTNASSFSLTNAINLGTATNVYVWLSLVAITNTASVGTINHVFDLSPDGINWSTRATKLIVPITLNGTTTVTVWTNIPVGSGQYLRYHGYENSDTNFCTNFVGYVFIPNRQ